MPSLPPGPSFIKTILALMVAIGSFGSLLLAVYSQDVGFITPVLAILLSGFSFSYAILSRRDPKTVTAQAFFMIALGVCAVEGFVLFSTQFAK